MADIALIYAVGKDQGWSIEWMDKVRKELNPGYVHAMYIVGSETIEYQVDEILRASSRVWAKEN